MDMSNDDLYYYWLCTLKEVWTGTRHMLLQDFGDVKHIFDADEALLSGRPYLSPLMIQALTNPKAKDDLEHRYLDFIDRGYHITYPGKDDYPKRLMDLEDRPVGLFYAGRLPSEDKKTLSIIGARKCSALGKARAEGFARILAAHDVQIISGMAHGIDGYAHRGALEAGGETFAILGSGLDICYPREHWHLYQSIPLSGGCISEFALGDHPASWHFPMRNRIISGLSDAILVIEARANSGSIHTVNHALNQGRDVYVIPGRPEDTLSTGCNNLLGEGAGMICSPGELMDALGIIQKQTPKDGIALDPVERLVYEAISSIPKSVEALAYELQLELQVIYYTVYKLEKRGLITQIHRNNYIRKI